MENTLCTIGGIAAVFNALVAGCILGYHFGRWSKGKEAVAPAAPGAARLVVELRGGDCGRRGAPPAPGCGDAADGGGEGGDNGDGPGDDPDDNA